MRPTSGRINENELQWVNSRKCCLCIFMKSDLIWFTCACKQNGELANLDKYHYWLPINFSQRKSFFQDVTTCHVTTRRVTAVFPGSSSLWTRARCLGYSSERTLSTKGRSRRRRWGWRRRRRRRSRGVASKTGSWPRPFCMFKLETGNPHPLPADSPGSRCSSSPHTDMKWTHINLGDILWAAAARIPNIQ